MKHAPHTLCMQRMRTRAERAGAGGRRALCNDSGARGDRSAGGPPLSRSLETRPSPSSTRACSVSFNYAWEYFRRQKKILPRVIITYGACARGGGGRRPGFEASSRVVRPRRASRCQGILTTGGRGYMPWMEPERDEGVIMMNIQVMTFRAVG